MLYSESTQMVTVFSEIQYCGFKLVQNRAALFGNHYFIWYHFGTQEIKSTFNYFLLKNVRKSGLILFYRSYPITNNHQKNHIDIKNRRVLI